MNTSKTSSPLNAALKNVPNDFRWRIIKYFTATKSALVEGRDEAVGIAAAKLCETVLRLLQDQVHGNFTAFGKGIGNFADECRKLITSKNSSVSDSLRVVMPRALVFVYTIRNKRGIGHIGGDVDANRIDAMTSARTVDWIVCELIRVFHHMSLEEAQDMIDGLAVRNIPEIWEVVGKKRVLREGLTFKQKVLVLCYQEQSSSVFAEDLFEWVEYSSFSMFKARVLSKLHDERLIEHDQETDSVLISPIGILEVEKNILSYKLA